MPLYSPTAAGVLLTPSLIEARLAINHPAPAPGTAGLTALVTQCWARDRETDSVPRLQISQLLEFWFLQTQYVETLRRLILKQRFPTHLESFLS